MYEEVEKDDVVVGRERERKRGRERDDIASFGRVEVDDLTNQREHILLSEEQLQYITMERLEERSLERLHVCNVECNV